MLNWGERAGLSVSNHLRSTDFSNDLNPVRHLDQLVQHEPGNVLPQTYTYTCGQWQIYQWTETSKIWLPSNDRGGGGHLSGVKRELNYKNFQRRRRRWLGGKSQTNENNWRG